MDMDKAILNDDPGVTLTIRLIMQGKVSKWFYLMLVAIKRALFLFWILTHDYRLQKPFMSCITELKKP